jgi:hypothetical protein
MGEALRGFDSFVASAALVPPYTIGATLLSVSLPAKVTVGGIDMDVDALDSNATPLLSLNIGDVVDDDRFVAADTTARAGGLLEYRPANTAWYRYNLAASVLVTVDVAPATAQNGAIAATIYGYPSLDIADVQKMVLQVLGVLAEGETPRAEDAVLALGAIEEIHEQLRFKQLANRQDLAWPVSLIPTFAGRSYARMAANLLADTFGVSVQRAQIMAQRAVEAEREMRRQTAIKSIGEPVDMEPYLNSPDYYLDEGVLA